MPRRNWTRKTSRALPPSLTSLEVRRNFSTAWVLPVLRHFCKVFFFCVWAQTPRYSFIVVRFFSNFYEFQWISRKFIPRPLWTQSLEIYGIYHRICFSPAIRWFLYLFLGQTNKQPVMETGAKKQWCVRRGLRRGAIKNFQRVPLCLLVWKTFVKSSKGGVSAFSPRSFPMWRGTGVENLKTRKFRWK